MNKLEVENHLRKKMERVNIVILFFMIKVKVRKVMLEAIYLLIRKLKVVDLMLVNKNKSKMLRNREVKNQLIHLFKISKSKVKNLNNLLSEMKKLKVNIVHYTLQWDKKKLKANILLFTLQQKNKMSRVSTQISDRKKKKV